MGKTVEHNIDFNTQYFSNTYKEHHWPYRWVHLSPFQTLPNHNLSVTSIRVTANRGLNTFNFWRANSAELFWTIEFLEGCVVNKDRKKCYNITHLNCNVCAQLTSPTVIVYFLWSQKHFGRSKHQESGETVWCSQVSLFGKTRFWPLILQWQLEQ